jgi:hypothetical protein
MRRRWQVAGALCALLQAGMCEEPLPQAVPLAYTHPPPPLPLPPLPLPPLPPPPLPPPPLLPPPLPPPPPAPVPPAPPAACATACEREAAAEQGAQTLSLWHEALQVRIPRAWLCACGAAACDAA